ncbi:MAG: M48 family metallopeptidase [Saprospiraceae bacterium]|nr:M48 family metallopeptidase [Saprospiraceae bacterium]
MKRKIYLQLLVILALFFSIWLGLSQIPFVQIFNIDEMDDELEEKLGELIWKSLKSENEELSDSLVVSSIEDILFQITDENNIDFDNIKLHVLDSEDINAFALPDDHIVVLKGLVQFADVPEEIAGVLAHELVHLEENHVMKKLVKEIGLSILIGATTGNANIGAISEIARSISGSIYDRQLETEADLKGVDYLIEANIDPRPMSDFMYKMALEYDHIPDAFYWISSHPNSKERAKAIHEHIGETDTDYNTLLDSTRWSDLKSIVE